jgi:phage tail protein X
MLRFIKLDDVAKAEDLAGIAYQLKASTTGATLTAASEALFLANPLLRDAKKIPKGTLVLVPDIGKVPTAKDAEPVEIPLGKGALLTDKQIASLAADTAAAAKAAKQASIDTKDALRVAKKFIPDLAPGVESLLDKIAEQADRRAESAQKLEKSLRKTYARMAEDMQRLQDL